MITRILFSVLVVVSFFLSPFWIWIPILFFGCVYFRFYIEGIFLALLAYMLYPYLFPYSFLLPIGAFVCIVFAKQIRDIIRA
jgi:hypothetical protein